MFRELLTYLSMSAGGILRVEPVRTTKLDATNGQEPANRLAVRCFSATKAGNSAAECEDTYIWLQDGAVYRFAVADGATEYSFAREWAMSLAERFVRQPVWGTSSELEAWLLPLQREWATWLRDRDLQWFAKRKAELGTFATLTGLEIQPDGVWRAIAVGDSCLFVERAGTLIHSFPVKKSSEIAYHPHLLGTPMRTDLPALRYLSDRARTGDRLYLVTDALAGWILKTLESNCNPWLQLDRIATQVAFVEWVETLRDRQEIRNDDTTLVRIAIGRLSEEPSPNDDFARVTTRST